MAESGITHSEVDGAHLIEHGDICEMCEDTASVGYCSGCECYICQSCFNNHAKVKKNHYHVLQTAPECKEDDPKIHFKTCTEHTQQEVCLYCTDHKCFGCAECMLFNHRSCEYKYITEASKEFQDNGELTLFLEDIQGLDNIHENCVESIASQSELSNYIDKTSINDVQKIVKDVISYVNDEEKRVIKDIVLKKSLNDDKIEKLSDDLQRIGSEITCVSTNVKSEDEIHNIFILAVEAKPKLSQIRDKLESIDCQEAIDRYTFHPNGIFKRLLSEKRPLGKLSDNTQSEEDDDEDYERKYKAECLDNQRLKKQLSTQTQEYQRLRLHLSSQYRLACGHICYVEQMNEYRTIRCPTCGTIFSDQPHGTLKTEEMSYFIELKFKFDEGVQSKLNLKPGKPYERHEVTGYLDDYGDGPAILNMFKLAFDRKLLFTINGDGKIVTNRIDIFTESPPSSSKIPERRLWEQRLDDYIRKVKKQLLARGITEADVYM